MVMEPSFQSQQILQRYDLPFEGNTLYSYHELTELNVDREFIYALLQTFEDEGTFSPDTFQKFSLDTIIDYIRRTHRYYLSKKLCEIEQSISILLKDYDGGHPLLVILNNFYRDYKNNLTEHIKVEEEYVLPRIERILKLEQEEAAENGLINTSEALSLKNFIQNHHDTEDDLLQVRRTISQYDPPVTNQTPYRILLTQLQMFEKDLAVHALIEDYVLIPRALQLEEGLRKKGLMN
jgi:regulator of cell morphogenesis and NO signaling